MYQSYLAPRKCETSHMIQHTPEYRTVFLFILAKITNVIIALEVEELFIEAAYVCTCPSTPLLIVERMYVCQHVPHFSSLAAFSATYLSQF